MTETHLLSRRPRRSTRGGALLNRVPRLFHGAGLRAPAALAIIAASIATPVLIRLSVPNANLDIPAQAAMAARMVKGGGWISYTLWYPLIYVSSSGSADPRGSGPSPSDFSILPCHSCRCKDAPRLLHCLGMHATSRFLRGHSSPHARGDATAQPMAIRRHLPRSS
jgi:hypothetical protein